MSEPDLGGIADRVVAIAGEVAKGADVFARVTRNHAANVRFARNSMTTSGEFDETVVGVQISLGQRHAYTTSNQTDAASIQALVQRAAEMARLSPVDPEHMPSLGLQTYAKGPEPFDAALATRGPDERAAIAKRAINEADAKKVQIAGFWEQSDGARAVRSSAGLRAADRESTATYTVTARTTDNTGSGWGGRESHRIADLEDLTIARTAIDKAVRSAQPRAVPPGKYTVILEPQAVAEMMGFLLHQLDSRSADEGRSFFTGKLGKSVFADFVSLKSNPSNPDTPSGAFDAEGFPLRPQTWIDGGVVKELAVSRYWGQKQGTTPTGRHDVFELSGGRAESIEELVAGTKRGLLVTRFWYNRMLEPQSIMLTGLTRDGLYLVEEGKVTAPLTNFRYNESPVTVLKNVEAMTKKTFRAADVNDKWHVPALRCHDFTMASSSAAV